MSKSIHELGIESGLLESYLEVSKIIKVLDYTSILKSKGMLSGRNQDRNPVWTYSFGEGLYDFFKKNCNYPYRYSVLPEKYLNIATEIRMFFISLDAYIESKNSVMEVDDIIKSTCLLGPRYAVKLKKIRHKSFIRSAYLKTFEKDESLENLKSYYINDIGQIFNYRFLIHWKEEDEEDYKWGFEPLRQDEKTLKRFKKVLKNILEDIDFEKIDVREVRTSLTGSSVYSPKFKKNFQARGHIKNLQQLPKIRGRCKRAIVPVCPAGTRDTVINSEEDLTRIQLIDAQVRDILEKNFSKYILNNDLIKFKNKYKKFQEKNSYFICRDIKKEGITKPRNLMKLMLEGLYEATKLDIFSESSYFDNYEVELQNKTVIRPPRGHGLGMGNSLTTLMQITAFFLTLTYGDYGEEIHPKLLVHNDDCIMGFDTKEQAMLFWIEEEDIFSGLGILRNAKKSFHGKGGVFCEEYFHKNGTFCDNQKEHYFRREMLSALNAENITHAKSITTSLNPRYFLDYREELISRWGYEFFPEESDYPARFGGWINRTMNGIGLDLLEIKPESYKVILSKAYEACKENSIKARKPKPDPDWRSPLQKLYPLAKIDERLRQSLDFLPYEEVAKKYLRKRNDPNKYTDAWIRLMEDRRKIFNKSVACTYEQLMTRAFIESQIDLYPPECLIERYSEGCWSFGDMDDPYLFKNPKISYLNYIEGRKETNIMNNSYGIENIKSSAINQRRTNTERKNLSKIIQLSSQVIGDFLRGEYLMPNEEDWEVFFERYRTPLNIAITSQYFRLDGKIPLIKDLGKNNLIYESRKTVYGKLLSKIEYLTLSEMRKKDIIEFRENGIDIFDLIELPQDAFNELIEEMQTIISEKNKPEESVSLSHSSEEDYTDIKPESVYFFQIPIEKRKSLYYDWKYSHDLDDPYWNIWQLVNGVELASRSLASYNLLREDRDEINKELLEDPIEVEIAKRWDSSFLLHLLSPFNAAMIIRRLITPDESSESSGTAEWGLFGEESSG